MPAALSEIAWAACLEAEAGPAALAELRLWPGLEVAAAAHYCWLRGAAKAPDEALSLALRKIPGLRLFRVLPGGELLAAGTRVPEGRLPALEWQPLSRAIPVEWPRARSAPRAVAPLALTLKPSPLLQLGGALLAEAGAWRDWASQAAAVRLSPLRFAADARGRVWIEGDPLPSMPGRRYYLRAGVACPCGFAWEPAFDPEIIAAKLGLAKGDTAFIREDGRWEILRAEQFVPASRSGARLAAEGLFV